jgi:hypothetical protein
MVRQMKDCSTAFIEFKRLIAGLREWGYDVRDDGEFGEFSLGGFVCSYRYFGVLDVNFLNPGQLLADDPEPDFMLVWNGSSWEEPTDNIMARETLSTAELYRTCVRTINFMAGGAVGIGATFCIVPQRVA